ncbi:MAG TPA: putative quinol monooxygenase [Phenylobacterium sp.]|nr:putative quinol monooxygenase [Phenylobacterium sp.]
MPIQVIVLIETVPGERQAVLDAFNRNAVTVRAEAGCIEYAAYADAGGFNPPIVPFGADTLVVLERWERVEDLNAHARAPHTRAYQAEVKDRVARRTVHLLSAV